MRHHTGTMLAGFIYLAIALAFILEALGVWTIRIADLRVVGPLTLVVIGLVVILGSLNRDTSDVNS